MTCALAAQEKEIYTVAEKMPEFPGGTDALAQYITMNMKFPASAREKNFSGKVYINFMIDTLGKINSTKIVKSSGDADCDQEAVRLIKMMPNWIPGEDSGKKVNVSMNIPIGFKNLGNLREDSNQPKLTKEQKEKHESAMADWNEGHKLEQRYMFDKALVKFNNSLSIEPDNKYAMFDKGKMHMALGQKNEACEVWNKMIRKNIRKDEAEEFVKKYCVGENGVQEMAKYYNNMKAGNFLSSGLSEVRNGRYEAALRRFDSSLKYSPEYKDALFNKGLMHFKLDQKNTACAVWGKLLAINPEDKETEDTIKKHCN